MGFDITALSHLKAIGDHTDGEWCDNDNHQTAYAYDDFPQSFHGIPVLSTRQLSGSSFLWGGCYARTEGTDTHEFRAGSYGGYNTWRADLQSQFNPERDPDGPFYELIWFADNEGTIGELAAVELLADFRHHAGLYDGSEYSREKYADWTRACELAATGGLICFH